MQFIILFIGVMVFVFYLFNQPPVFHNEVLMERAKQTEYAASLEKLSSEYNTLYAEKRQHVDELVGALQNNDREKVESNRIALLDQTQKEREIRDSVRSTSVLAIPGAKREDRDYIFLNFVLNHLPHGIVGLILAVMFSAAMSSMAGELNALASTTSIDIYKRTIKPEASPAHYLFASRAFTVLWALLAMLFAMLASFAENLIQFVNIVGSLFYGTILGIFLAAFYFKRLQGTAVFIAAIISEAIVLYCAKYTDIAFLLYNIIGCAAVLIFATLFQILLPNKKEARGG